MTAAPKQITNTEAKVILVTKGRLDLGASSLLFYIRMLTFAHRESPRSGHQRARRKGHGHRAQGDARKGLSDPWYVSLFCLTMGGAYLPLNKSSVTLETRESSSRSPLEACHPAAINERRPSRPEIHIRIHTHEYNPKKSHPRRPCGA